MAIRRLTLDFPTEESFQRVSQAYGRELGLFDEAGNRIGATEEQLMGYIVAVIQSKVKDHETLVIIEQEQAANAAAAIAAAEAAAAQPELGMIPGGGVIEETP